MDQETCLILGQFFIQFTLLGEESSRRIYVIQVETDKTASDIQARSFMARNSGRNWEEMLS